MFVEMRRSHCAWVPPLVFCVCGSVFGGDAGRVVGWGSQVVGVELAGGFSSVATWGLHGLSLRTDGFIAAWGDNRSGRCHVPSPNTDFVAIAAGGLHDLGLKSDGAIVAWGCDITSPWYSGECEVPVPNAGFIGIAPGSHHNLGLKGIRGDRDADGDVDLVDFEEHFGDCLRKGGPGVASRSGCHDAYLGIDRFIHLKDFAAFQNAFSGP